MSEYFLNILTNIYSSTACLCENIESVAGGIQNHFTSVNQIKGCSAFHSSDYQIQLLIFFSFLTTHVIIMKSTRVVATRAHGQRKAIFIFRNIEAFYTRTVVARAIVTPHAPGFSIALRNRSGTLATCLASEKTLSKERLQPDMTEAYYPNLTIQRRTVHRILNSFELILNDAIFLPGHLK